MSNSGVPTAANPFHFIVRGDVPSLKNDRELFKVKKKDGTERWVNPPNAEVKRFIAHCRATFTRQLPAGWKPIEVPQQVAYVVVWGVYVKDTTKLPTKDTDNGNTTIQEAMAPVLIENDKQVVGFTAFRRLLKSPSNLYTEVWVWQTSGDFKDYATEQSEFMRRFL